MAVNFPNRSRSYDATRRAVHFWGHDRSMESSFFVTADALNRIQPNLRFDAVDLLRAFDINPRAHLRDCRKGLCPRPQRLLRAQRG